MNNTKVIKESKERRKDRVALAKCVAEKTEENPKAYKRHDKHKGQNHFISEWED